MRRSSSQQSKKFVVKRRTRTIFASVVAVLIVGVSIFGLSKLFSTGALSITAVQVAGVNTSDTDRIQAAALQSLQGTYFGLFSRSNTLIYPHDSVVDAISAVYPEAQTIAVERTGVHGLEVTITEKEPAALICTTLPDFDGNELRLEDPGACYFADKEGIVFKRSPSFSGTLYGRYYIPDLAPAASVDVEAESVIIGKHATSTPEFTLLQDIYGSLEGVGITVQAILIKGGGEYELYARNPGSETSTVVIYFDTITQPKRQIENLISFWNHSVETAKENRQTLEFDSIDVRYAPHVYSTQRTSSI